MRRTHLLCACVQRVRLAADGEKTNTLGGEKKVVLKNYSTSTERVCVYLLINLLRYYCVGTYALYVTGTPPPHPPRSGNRHLGCVMDVFFSREPVPRQPHGVLRYFTYIVLSQSLPVPFRRVPVQPRKELNESRVARETNETRKRLRCRAGAAKLFLVAVY